MWGHRVDSWSGRFHMPRATTEAFLPERQPLKLSCPRDRASEGKPQQPEACAPQLEKSRSAIKIQHSQKKKEKKVLRNYRHSGLVLANPGNILWSCSKYLLKLLINGIRYFIQWDMDQRAWWAIVHGVAKSRTWLSNFTFTFFNCFILEGLYNAGDGRGLGVGTWYSQSKTIIQVVASVQFSHSVVSDSLWPHESQHSRPPCPSPTQTHVHLVGDAIQPSHPLSSPSPPAPNPSQHQGLFQWLNSSHEVAKDSS